MHYLVHYPNPLDHGQHEACALDGATIIDLLTKKWPDWQNFETPHIVLVNGVPALRATWNSPLEAESTVSVMAVPFGAETILAAAAIWAVSTLVTSALASLAVPAVPKIGVTAPPTGAPVFTFEGRVNKQRLNQVIEVAYGRNRWYPSYVCAPRVEYTNNLSYLHLWLSLGLGEFEIEAVNIGDTPFDQLPECRYVNFGPMSYPNVRALSWSHPDGFYDKVYTSNVLENVALRAPNEDNYAIVGPFPINPVGTTITRVQLNIVFPGGLYGLSAGAVVSRAVSVSVTLSKIDDRGLVLESNTQTLTFSGASATPQRFTRYLTVTTGRWQIALNRTTSKDAGSSQQDDAVLEVVYGLGDGAVVYAPTTLYARILGTSLAAKDAASKLNVVATRKIPVYDTVSATWSVEPTRNPIWAMLDVLRADYGANQSDDNFDLIYFADLAANCQTTFDHIFNQKTKAWEAVKAICQALRATPYIAGSDYRLAFDRVDDQPVAFFGPDNASDLVWTSTFNQPLDSDSVIASYVDSITGLEASVQFTPNGSDGVNPQKIELVGVTDRTHAWQTAAYVYMQQVLRRDQVSFTVGLDGFIPMFGDVISVAWPFPEWGSAGVITAAAGLVLTLSDPVTFEVGKTYWMALRLLDGTFFGPFKVAGTGTTTSVTAQSVSFTGFDFSALGQDPIMFTFGTSTTLSRWFRVTSSKASKAHVEIEAVAFDPGAFAYDAIAAPIPSQEFSPMPAPDGSVGWIKVYESSSDYLKVLWAPSPGAVGYLVYYAFNPTVDLMSLRRWPEGALTGYSFTVASVFPTFAFIPRAPGDLAVKVIPLSSLSPETPIGGHLYWCGIIGAYDQSASQNRASAILLVNNQNTSIGRPSGEAQGCLGLSPVGAALWSVGDKYLAFKVDAPDNSYTEIELQWKTDWPRFGQHSYNTWSLKVSLPTGGVATFTPEMMAEAGWPIAAQYYVTIYLKAIVRGVASVTPFEVGVTPVLINYSTAGGQVKVVSSAKSGIIDCTGHLVPPWAEGAVRVKTEARLDYTLDVDCTKYGEYQQEWSGIKDTPMVTTNRRIAFHRWNYLSTRVVGCYPTTDQFGTTYYAIQGDPVPSFDRPGPSAWSWRERINFYAGQPFHLKLFVPDTDQETTVNGKYLQATLVELADTTYLWAIKQEGGATLTAGDISAIETMRRTTGLTLVIPDCKLYSGVSLLTVSCKFRDILGNESTGFNPQVVVTTP